jgi:hypothetical protein
MHGRVAPLGAVRLLRSVTLGSTLRLRVACPMLDYSSTSRRTAALATTATSLHPGHLCAC